MERFKNKIEMIFQTIYLNETLYIKGYFYIFIRISR